MSTSELKLKIKTIWATTKVNVSFIYPRLDYEGKLSRIERLIGSELKQE